MSKKVFLILSIGPSLFAGLGCWLLVINLSLLLIGTRTEGTVIDYEVSQDSDSSTYCPIVQFKLENGSIYEKRMNQCSGSREYEVGSLIPLLYSKDAKKVVIYTFGWMFLVPGLFFGFGLFFLIPLRYFYRLSE